MIGDSYVDYKAALNNKIAFILRRTLFNRKIQKTLKCTQIDNFL
jgi:phosphoglycolate phosphatase-like HAD superfamily hydrolase